MSEATEGIERGSDTASGSPLACPFCGSDNLEETLWRGKLMISCNDCQATGPWASSWQEAMEDDRPRRRAWSLWNRRATGKISQRQLESILTHEGIVHYDAVEDPEGYDGGETELHISVACREINRVIQENDTAQTPTTGASADTHINHQTT